MTRTLIDIGKMSSSRQISAGLARNINNLMSVVLGHVEIMKKNISQGRVEELQTSLDKIHSSSWQAVSISRRLLYYTQEQLLQTESCDLNGITADVLRDVEFESNIETSIKVDQQEVLLQTEAARIETLVFALVQNALDAMPDGGRLTVSTCRVDGAALPESAASCVERGEYWRLRVQDTGEGTLIDVFLPL